MAYLLIDPDETLNYTFDWSSIAGSNNINTSTWTISPTGPTLASDSIDNSTKKTTIYLSGCTAGKVYQLINTVAIATIATTEQKSVAIRCHPL